MCNGQYIFFISFTSVFLYDGKTGTEKEIFTSANNFVGITLDRKIQEIFAWVQFSGVVSFTYGGERRRTVPVHSVEYDGAMALVADEINM